MATRVTVTAFYEGDADAIFAQAMQFAELREAMAGLAEYRGLPDQAAEEGQTLMVDVTFWGLITMTGHVIHVERLDQPARIIQSRESNPSIRRWDHTLSVQPDGARVRWTDSVILDAGWQTFLTARFCAYVYRRRHRHRQALEITTDYTSV